MSVSTSSSISSILLGASSTTTNDSASKIFTILRTNSNGNNTNYNYSGGMQGVLDQIDVQAARQRIMLGAIDRIRDVAIGAIEPEAEWETLGGFLAATGQPFHMEVNNLGEVEVKAQAETISELPLSQQKRATETIERLDEVIKLYDEEFTKDQLRTELHYAVLRMNEMKNHAPAREQWEEDYLSFRKVGRPMIVSLNENGEVAVYDQIETGFSYIEDDIKRAKLQEAGREMEDILSGETAATEFWQYSAIGRKDAGQDYFLDVDDEGEIVVRNNTQSIPQKSISAYFQSEVRNEFYMVPEYLRDAGTYDFYENDWEEEAMAFYGNNTPFHLDFTSSNIKVQETDYNSILLRDILSTDRASQIAQARISLLL